MDSIKDLPEEFTRLGQTYQRILHSKAAYLYRVFDDQLDVGYYEVFKTKIKARYDFEAKKPAGDFYVKYPSDEDFGKWAWCIVRDTDEKGLEDSIKIFNTLSN